MRPLLILLALLTFIRVPQAPSVRVVGPKELVITAAELGLMPRVTVKTTSHGEEATYEGVLVRELLTRAGVPSGSDLRGKAVASTVVVTGLDGYRAAFGLAEFDPGFTDRISILADRRNGTALPNDAAPFQLILMGEKRAARWVRQVTSIEVRP